MADCNVSLEKYAELCARMASTGGDLSREHQEAAASGVSPADWDAAKAFYTAKMSDPADMGRTAMAFMPLYQAAQAAMRGGAEPGTLETYARVHAEMAYGKDPSDPSRKVDFMSVLEANGFTHAAWLEMEGYWTPRVAMDSDPRFDPELAARFAGLIQKEADRVLGIVR